MNCPSFTIHNSPFALLSPGAGEDDGDGEPEDLDVEPEGPVIDVFEVEADPVAEVFDVVAAADLPEAGKAGFDAEAAAMGEVVEAFDFIDGKRARADQAHFTAKDVEELGPFIDAEFAQEFSD